MLKLKGIFYAKITLVMKIIDGRKIRDEILAGLKPRIDALTFAPIFCDVVVGDDPASLQYVRMKEEVAKNLGIQIEQGIFPKDISTEDLITEVKRIADIPYMAGLIIQLPLPSHIDRDAVLSAVPLAIDVDVTGKEASDLFYANTPRFIFPTALAVLAALDSLSIETAQKKVVMVGQGMLVGKPVTHLLRMRGMDVATVTKNTENSEQIYKTADIVISAVGIPNLIKGEHLKQGVIVVDAGTSELEGGIVGDVDRASVEDVAFAISPVPGGVGPVTVAMLMQNIVLSAEKNSLI
jgi:5,10-methylene-tetrahydrofolate dehydrogenase/methenyl tetrahydrofolate cyclohydrolase